MKYFAVILLVGLSVASISCKTYDKGSTVVDYLKDGFDTVYHFNEHTMVKHGAVKDIEGVRADVHLRRTKTNDDPKKFVMHLSDVYLIGEHEEPPTEADLAASLLPIIVVAQNDDLDFDHIYATEADTKKSLNWKHDALSLILHNMTEQVYDMQDIISPVTVEMTLDDMPFGTCTLQFTVKNKRNKLSMEMRAKRRDCTGDVEKDIFEDLAEYGVTSIDADSEMKFGFVYSSLTGQFTKSYMRIHGSGSGKIDVSFDIVMELKFDRFVEIEKPFDETKIVKRYNETDIE